MNKKKLLIMALLSLVAAVALQIAIDRVNRTTQAQEVYMLKEALAVGQVVDLSKCMVLRLVLEEGEADNYLDRSALLNKPQLKQALNAGTILQKPHLTSDAKQADHYSMVMKLNHESAHQGEFAIGEPVDVLCYRQGEMKRLQGLEIIRIEREARMDESFYWLTVKGEARDFEAIMLAQSEGIVRIIKKVSIQ